MFVFIGNYCTNLSFISFFQKGWFETERQCISTIYVKFKDGSSIQPRFDSQAVRDEVFDSLVRRVTLENTVC